ncbi:MAG TPA: DEAD/DEAH box helicase, partial [Tepidisphaeraceae bacterium]|nr:DEAD/DEAH box helicase [Tepidisphaeraceae bacterium]
LELKTDLEDGLLPQALAQFPTDDDLLAAYGESKAVVEAAASGKSETSGPALPPELVTPLIPAQAATAQPVLSSYGLGLDLASAERLEQFLSGLHARLLCLELLQDISIPVGPLPEDAVLLKLMKDATTTIDFLIKVMRSAALRCVRVHIRAVLRDASAMAQLLDGLDRSPERVTGILKLLAAVANTKLIRDSWAAALDRRLRKGSLEEPTLGALNERLDSLEAVLRVSTGLTALPEILRRAAEALIALSADAERGLATLRRSALAAEITARLKSDPSLHEIDRQRIDSSFDRYRALDAQKREAVRNATHHLWVTRQKERLLANTGSRLNAAGAELRRRLTIQGERAMRLRQVISLGRGAEGGDPLFDLCPVWMASPETVAQLFPREPIFDVVIFDEASQCRLEEALPVLTRARRVVIAGDPQQLPPTRFFESAVAESTDEEIESDQQLFETRQGEIEDLLAGALNLEIQQSYLDVHYRSRNSDLIQFSNEHFYNSRLQPIPVHPSRRARFAPVTLYRADGTYEKRANELEAEQVCTIVADLLKRSEPPSIGIACFNLPQRDLIVEKLEEKALEEPSFGKRLAAARTRQGAGSPESLFVKNLENVQGDERDHIIISTTYGPDPSGKFHRRFGPVGRQGGGRRLNVLVTRARQEVHVVTSIPAEAYRSLPPVPKGQAPSGAWLLFAYLSYAERLAESYEADRPAKAEPVVEGTEGT